MKKAIFSGTFDPITFGHIDLIERTSRMFDEVYVVIGVNPDKKPLFDSNRRMEFMQNALKHLPNIIVGSFSGLLAEFAYDNAIRYVVRGFRNSADLEYEKNIASVNASISGLETIYLHTSDRYAHVSSSMVKSVVKEFGNVGEWVPLQVKSALEKQILSKMLVGVVGNSGSGKSHLISNLVRLGNDVVKHIDMDKMVHSIYESNAPYALQAKEQLMHRFGAGIFDSGSMSIDRKALGKLVFANRDNLNALNQIMSAPIRHALYQEFRNHIYDNSRVILVDGAVIAQNGHSSLVNNNMLHVTCDNATRITRIMQRDSITDTDAKNRLASQNFDISGIINDSIAKHKYGTQITFDATAEYTDETVEDLLVEILKMW